RLQIIDDSDSLIGLIAHGFYCGLQNSVVRRDVFEGQQFETRTRNEGEDLLAAVRAAARGSRFGYFDDVHVVYSVHETNSSTPTGGGASVDKRLTTMRLSLEGFEALRNQLPLPPAARRALDRMISQHYFWSIGYSLLWSNGRRAEALEIYRKALRMWPWSPAC